MGVVLEPVAGRVSEAPRHPEVNQETATALEPKNQILAATIECRDPLADELRLDEPGVVRPRQPRVGDHHGLETPTRDDRLEPAADRLDLGQLGHTASVAMAGGRAAGYDVTTSSRIGRSGGAWSAMT